MLTMTKTSLTSAELGILWLTYQNNSLMQQMIGVFETKTTDQNAKEILHSYVIENQNVLDDIKKIYNKENAILPMAFSSSDVFNDAPALFDDIFNIMFLRCMMKIDLGLDALHLGISFRKDIRDFFEKALINSRNIYNNCTDYLTEQGVLAKAPYVSMPKKIEFIEDDSYMSGIQLMGNRRSLNALEVAYLFNILESNVMGLQLMSGFAQVAKEREVKDYFNDGKELAKKIIGSLSDILLQSDIQPSTTWAGHATDSVISLFSDKLMMFLPNIICSYASGGEALGMAFSLRSDLPAKLAVIAKDTMDYAKVGGKLMIKHKWLEKPPQMTDGN